MWGDIFLCNLGTDVASVLRLQNRDSWEHGLFATNPHRQGQLTLLDSERLFFCGQLDLLVM